MVGLLERVLKLFVPSDLLVQSVACQCCNLNLVQGLRVEVQARSHIFGGIVQEIISMAILSH